MKNIFVIQCYSHDFICHFIIFYQQLSRYILFLDDRPTTPSCFKRFLAVRCSLVLTSLSLMHLGEVYELGICKPGHMIVVIVMPSSSSSSSSSHHHHHHHHHHHRHRHHHRHHHHHHHHQPRQPPCFDHDVFPISFPESTDNNTTKFRCFIIPMGPHVFIDLEEVYEIAAHLKISEHHFMIAYTWTIDNRTRKIPQIYLL